MCVWVCVGGRGAWGWGGCEIAGWGQGLGAGGQGDTGLSEMGVCVCG